MTSLAFLVVYGAVSLGHLRVRRQTGAVAWPLVAAVVFNTGLFVVLLVDAVRSGSPATWITLVGRLDRGLCFEAWYRRRPTGATGAAASGWVRRSCGAAPVLSLAVLGQVLLEARRKRGSSSPTLPLPNASGGGIDHR